MSGADYGLHNGTVDSGPDFDVGVERTTTATVRVSREFGECWTVGGSYLSGSYLPLCCTAIDETDAGPRERLRGRLRIRHPGSRQGRRSNIIVNKVFVSETDMQLTSAPLPFGTTASSQKKARTNSPNILLSLTFSHNSFLLWEISIASTFDDTLDVITCAAASCLCGKSMAASTFYTLDVVVVFVVVLPLKLCYVGLCVLTK